MGRYRIFSPKSSEQMQNIMKTQNRVRTIYEHLDTQKITDDMFFLDEAKLEKKICMSPAASIPTFKENSKPFIPWLT